MTLTRDRNSTKPEPRLDIQDVLDDIVRRENDGVRDEPVLVPLHRTHHRRLRGRGLIVVDDTDAAKELDMFVKIR